MVNPSKAMRYKEELTPEVLEIITVFSARLYGSRNPKNKPLIERMKAVTTQDDADPAKVEPTPE